MLDQSKRGSEKLLGAWNARRLTEEGVQEIAKALEASPAAVESAVVAGGVAIWFGIPVKEFSFGNTMILAGAVAICSGLLLIGLSLVIRELRSIRQSLRERPPEADPREAAGPPLPAGSIAGPRGRPDRDEFDVRRVASESLALVGPRRQAASQPETADASGLDTVRAAIGADKSEPDAAPPR